MPTRPEPSSPTRLCDFLGAAPLAEPVLTAGQLHWIEGQLMRLHWQEVRSGLDPADRTWLVLVERVAWLERELAGAVTVRDTLQLTLDSLWPARAKGDADVPTP